MSITKEFLSGSTKGRGVKAVATSTPGTLVHVAPSGTTTKDEVWLYVTNTDTVARKITIEFGGVTAVDDTIVETVPAGRSLLVAPGLLAQDGNSIRAFGAAANVLSVFGFVNRI